MSIKIFWLIGILLLVCERLILPVFALALPVELVLLWVLVVVAADARWLERPVQLLALLLLADFSSGGQWGGMELAFLLTVLVLSLVAHWVIALQSNRRSGWLRPGIIAFLAYNLADWLWLNLDWLFGQLQNASQLFYGSWGKLQINGYLAGWGNKQLVLLVSTIILLILFNYARQEKISY